MEVAKEDFIELQHDLHRLNPSRNHKSYVTGQVLNAKTNFLRSRTATHPLTTTGSLVPKVVLHASEALIPTDAMEVDVDIESDKNIKLRENLERKDIDAEDARDGGGHEDVKAGVDGDDDDEDGDEDDEGEEEDEGEVEDEGDEEDEGEVNDEHSEGEGNSKNAKSYIDEDATVLSLGPTAIFPCTIRYMDLTCLNLRHFKRVSQVLLIRNEWDAVVDIFNQREIGFRGSAILTGQPGTGKHHCSP